jgi:hypothetical protein
LEERYTAKAKRVGASEAVVAAIGRYFSLMSGHFHKLDRMREKAEPLHVRSILALAERAYRRPLTKPERDDLTAFYQSLREREKVTHEEAIRDTLTSVLMSPHFLFRVDTVRPGTDAVRPLDDSSLASRLSYFLWSSMPDKALLDLAAAGELSKPEVLVAQARRMLKDAKVRGLVTEFAGHWLDMPVRSLPGDLFTPRMHWGANGASERMVVSPGHEADGIMEMPTGQSGHPMSPFYGSSHEAWISGAPTPASRSSPWLWSCSPRRDTTALRCGRSPSGCTSPRPRCTTTSAPRTTSSPA